MRNRYKLVLLFPLSLSLGIAKAQPANDAMNNAQQLTHTSSWISSDGGYTNVGATADGSGGGGDCGGAHNNVWFKFQATSNEIDVKVLMGGTKGTMGYPLLVLYDAGAIPIACHFTSNQQTSFLQKTNLNMGSWYYISVDNYIGSQGTFTLQVQNQISFDLREKAIEIPHTAGWKSGDALYTTENATSDGSGGGGNCGVAHNNVWFKFQATSKEVDIQLEAGGVKGTLSNLILALFDASSNSLDCQFTSSQQTAHIQKSNLTPGLWYYISVDNFNSNQGTFTLQLNGGASPSALCDNIYCTSEGSVGIGTPLVPSGYRMAVLGKIIAEGVKVELKSKWPDYVFANDYSLKPISEVRNYVEMNGHLPGIPSAAIAEKEGIDLGEMNVLLLRKIEELTLYLMKQDEQLQKQGDQIQQMKRILENK